MKNNNGGRPTVYKKEYSDQAYMYCLLGATDAQLTDFFEVRNLLLITGRKTIRSFWSQSGAGK